LSTSNQVSRKIGRLIAGRIAGTQCSEEEIAGLRDGTMGGITLFKDNAEDLVQLATLINQIYRAYEGGTPFVAVDQEGGAVQRFDHILTPLPSAMSLGAIGDRSVVDLVTRINARQSKLLGINCLLAPVMDVCSEPLNPIIATRAYSDNPNIVRELAKAAALAISDEGVIPVGKHFPGHGATKEDSHTQLAVNQADGKRLWQRELIPFKDCSEFVPAILTAHVWHPSIDAEPLPGSLSPRVTSGLLREYLNFDGLVMTDDLLMKAITDKWGLGEAAVLAILAGADLILVCGSMEQTREVHTALTEAVASGRITEQRLDEAVERVESAMRLTSKNAYSPENLSGTIERLRAQISADYDTALGATCQAMTVLKGELPQDFAGEWVVVAPDHKRYPLDLAARLKEWLGKVDHHKEATVLSQRYTVNPEADECSRIAEFCAGRNCIFVSYRSLINRGQQELAKLLSQYGIPALNVSVDTPYDFVVLPDWANCLATYDPSDLAVEAAAMVIAGKREPAGACPVELRYNPQLLI
jgi:beta-N-acetylhexosaminidase